MSTTERTSPGRGEWGAPRTKTITWYDPLRTAEAGASLSGLEHLRAIRDGVLAPPPMAAHFSFRIAEVELGDIVFTCTPDESAYNPIGVVHGGLVCTLLDSAIGCAVQSTLPAGSGYTSIELKVNYLRPVSHDTGELRARGLVTKPGRRIAFAEGDVRDSSGKVVATASGSCLVMAPGQ